MIEVTPAKASATTPPPMDEVTRKHRDALVSLGQESQRDYDKAVFSLSGGALGVSFAFLDRLIGDGPEMHLDWMIGAWAAWALSVSVVMVSHWLSAAAINDCIEQMDRTGKGSYTRTGWRSKSLAVANVLSGAAFVIGVFLAAVFVYTHRM